MTYIKDTIRNLKSVRQFQAETSLQHTQGLAPLLDLLKLRQADVSHRPRGRARAWSAQTAATHIFNTQATRLRRREAQQAENPARRTHTRRQRHRRKERGETHTPTGHTHKRRQTHTGRERSRRKTSSEKTAVGGRRRRDGYTHADRDTHKERRRGRGRRRVRQRAVAERVPNVTTEAHTKRKGCRDGGSENDDTNTLKKKKPTRNAQSAAVMVAVRTRPIFKRRKEHTQTETTALSRPQRHTQCLTTSSTACPSIPH